MLTASRIAAARLRFFLLLGGVLLVVAAWPTLRNYWDKLTRPDGVNPAVSPDTEYWCPMCPGVVADWPSKCPVCHMTLVRRQKGDMTPLPSGVVARVQFSPYRVQLAGIRTAAVEFRPLTRDVVMAGLLEAAKNAGENEPLWLDVDVPEADIEIVKVGQRVELSADAFPGQSFVARIVSVASQWNRTTRSVRARLEITDKRSLRPGMYVAGTLHVALADLERHRRQVLDYWRDRTAGSLAIAPLEGGLDALVEAAVLRAAGERGLVLTVPESCIVDTGAHKVVYVERSPGMFDGIEVRAGRRCDTFVPIFSGLEPGQKVVVAGAFLVDAETRLNPAAAGSYFGAGSRGASGASFAPAGDGLSPEDQQIVKKQRICPVTEEPLGSMGSPVRVMVEGRPVFICCEGCAPALKKEPKKFLAKLDGK